MNSEQELVQRYGKTALLLDAAEKVIVSPIKSTATYLAEGNIESRNLAKALVAGGAGISAAGAALIGGAPIIGGGALGAGAVGSFNASRQASRLSDLTNHNDPNTFLNRGKHLLAGFGGGLAGVATGVGAWGSAKDHAGKAVMDAIEKRNATAVQRGASGSTLFGRMGATGHRLFQGEGATSFDAQTREIAQKENIDKSAKDLFSYLEGKGKTDGAGYSVTTASFDGQANGVNFTGKTFTGSLNDLLREKQKAIAAQQAGTGDGTFMFDGMKFSTTDASVTKLEEELAYAAGDEWAKREEEKFATTGKMDNGYTQKRDTYNESLNGATDPNGTGLYKRYEATKDSTGAVTGTSFKASKLKKTSKAAGGEALRGKSSDSYKRQLADYGAAKKS